MLPERLGHQLHPPPPDTVNSAHHYCAKCLHGCTPQRNSCICA